MFVLPSVHDDDNTHAHGEVNVDSGWQTRQKMQNGEKECVRDWVGKRGRNRNENHGAPRWHWCSIKSLCFFIESIFFIVAAAVTIADVVLVMLISGLFFFLMTKWR